MLENKWGGHFSDSDSAMQKKSWYVQFNSDISHQQKHNTSHGPTCSHTISLPILLPNVRPTCSGLLCSILNDFLIIL